MRKWTRGSFNSTALPVSTSWNFAVEQVNGLIVARIYVPGSKPYFSSYRSFARKRFGRVRTLILCRRINWFTFVLGEIDRRSIGSFEEEREKTKKLGSRKEDKGEKKRAPVQIYRWVWLDGKTWAIPKYRPPGLSCRYECVSEFVEANLT